MNIGVIILALMMVCGVVLVIGVIASNQDTTYSDTYGETQNDASNLTKGNLTSTAVPISSFGVGLAAVFGFFAIVIAGLFLSGALKSGRSYQR